LIGDVGAANIGEDLHLPLHADQSDRGVTFVLHHDLIYKIVGNPLAMLVGTRPKAKGRT